MVYFLADVSRSRGAFMQVRQSLRCRYLKLDVGGDFTTQFCHACELESGVRSTLKCPAYSAYDPATFTTLSN